MAWTFLAKWQIMGFRVVQSCSGLRAKIGLFRNLSRVYVEPEVEIAPFAKWCDTWRHHEMVRNVTHDDVYHGRRERILAKRPQ